MIANVIIYLPDYTAPALFLAAVAALVWRFWPGPARRPARRKQKPRTRPKAKAKTASFHSSKNGKKITVQGDDFSPNLNNITGNE